MNKRKRNGIFYQVQQIAQPTATCKLSKTDEAILQVLDKSWDKSREAIIACNNATIGLKPQVIVTKEVKTAKNYLKLTDFD